MIIKLDQHTCIDLLNQCITDVNIEILHAGCAGSKISITPRTIMDDKISSEQCRGITCWIDPSLAPQLDGSQIARAKGSYYLVSKNIQSRCGCATSFSFEKKVILTNLAKIHRIRETLKSIPGYEQCKIIKK